MEGISLDSARKIVAGALAHGRQSGMKPLAVSVVDAGGHLVALEREDGASILRPEVAQGKATGALGLGVSSRKIAEMAAERPTFFAALAALSRAGIVPAPGGLLIGHPERGLIGAVGVSGDTSDNDEACALAGIRAAGLQPVEA